MIQSEHNQLNMNNIKNFLSKAVFAYFHYDSWKVPGGPPKPCRISKIFCMSYFFPLINSLETG